MLVSAPTYAIVMSFYQISELMSSKSVAESINTDCGMFWCRLSLASYTHADFLYDLSIMCH